jgi:hypothetical protein
MLDRIKLVNMLGSCREVSDHKELLFTCPTCGKEKLYVNARTGHGFCQRCQKAINFSRKCEGLPFDVNQLNKSPSEPPRSWLGFPPEAFPLYGECRTLNIFEDHQRKSARRYFEARGFSAEDAMPHGLHVCAAGKFHGRILFPVSYHGVIYSFIGRDYTGSTEKSHPKVMHPPRSKYPQESLGRFGLDACVSARIDAVVLVEGPFDALAVGSPPAIALQSTGIPDMALGVLLKNFSTFILFLDPDEPGRAGSKKLQERIASAGRQVAEISGHTSDPGALGKDACRAIVHKCLLEIESSGKILHSFT